MSDMEMAGDEMQEILQEFFTEADENLDTLEQDLIKLEALSAEGAGGTDKETVDRIFRMLHTLKGGAGFLGLEKIAKLAHAGENLLDEVRHGKVAIDKPVMDALLQTIDSLKQLLNCQKAGDDDADIDTTALRAALEALAKGEAVAVPAAKPTAPAAAAPAPAAGAQVKQELLASVLADETLDPSRDKEKEQEIAPATGPLVNQELLASVLADDTLDPSRDQEAVAPAGPHVNADLLAAVLSDATLDPSRDKGEDGPASASATAAPAVAAPAPVLKQAPAAEQRKGEDRRQGGEDRRQAPRRGGDEGGNETIRVETARLDKVMNLVGELVLARNTLMRQLNLPDTRRTLEKLENAPMIYGTVEQFSRVTQDLQMSVLSTRMQPIKKVFDKIPRQVRELKTQLGKEVNLMIEGEMTEVDKSLVEELADPMVHMIRNALDHGLEGPEERTAAGKHPEGTLMVRAFYEGNNVVIQVQEDGRGIDPNKIRKVAVKKGVVTEAVANAMSDAEAIRLIMAPGFSTAEQITDVSGRGVGMDVVNTKIANLQGSIEIRSELGLGTCFSIYMPLTLAIVNALIVGSNAEGFAIPIGDIAEVIKYRGESLHKVNEQDIIELRGEPLPLYYLAKLTKEGYLPSSRQIRVSNESFNLQPSENISLEDLDRLSRVNVPAAAAVGKPDSAFVVVVRDGSSALGLVVDELLGQEEVVVKPVTQMFEYHKAVSGATITGDGKVHMILDVPYMLKDLSGSAARK
ncbi:MAG: chemotaxis protein CheA [Alphaproteobacteria bacterium]|nr:chemotaxis protein CheA [Alphaproteobacteria bacterium]